MMYKINDIPADMEDMVIKFDGQTHQIEANTLISSLFHFTTVVHEVNKEINNGEKVVINIKAHNEGSFEVILNIAKDIANGTQTLFSVASLGYVTGLIDVVSGVYNAYQFLHGEKPKEIQSVEGGLVRVENNNGNINYFDFRVVNIVEGNQNIRGAISQGFDALSNDPNVTGLEFIKNGEKVVDVPRDEFRNLATSVDNGELQKNERLEIINSAMLRIVRLSFDPKMKSDFLYLGNKITAWVADEEFYREIDKGEAIRKGDVLEVMLEIKQQYDASLDAYVNKSYKVLRIDKHHPRSEQNDLSN